jgi:hypothetical protein|tara:strand:+ start:215 stop:346 length:132 start_codon:yes stop_codon:yes gene_type:complete
VKNISWNVELFELFGLELAYIASYLSSMGLWGNGTFSYFWHNH